MSSKREPESPDEIAEARIQGALGEQAGRLDLSELGLTSLPESLGKLSGLQTLYLSGNQLTSLPESLGKLSGLQKLDLSGNQLTSLPESLGKLSEPANALPFRQSAHEPAGVARQAERPANARPFRQSAHEPAGVRSAS